MNPMQIMVQAMRSGGDTEAAMKAALMQRWGQLAQTNPDAKKYLDMVQGKTPEEHSTLAQNLYASSGRDYDRFAQQFRNQTGL